MVCGRAVNVLLQPDGVLLLADAAGQRDRAVQAKADALDKRRLTHAVLAAEEHDRPVEPAGGVGRQVEGVDAAIDAKILKGHTA